MFLLFIALLLSPPFPIRQSFFPILQISSSVSSNSSSFLLFFVEEEFEETDEEICKTGKKIAGSEMRQ